MSPLHSRGSPTKGNKIRSGCHTLPYWGPKRGRKCYVTPAFSGTPNTAEQNQKRLPHPCLLKSPKEGGNAMSPLHSRGSPTKGNKIRSGCHTLPYRGPKRGRKCYVTPAFSGTPNTPEQNQKRLPHPCLLRGPKEGGNAMSPLHSRGSLKPSTGKKIRSGCLTPAFSKAQKRAEMLCHPCILGDPQQRGTKSEVAASPLPSRGPKRGRKCYVTLAFSGSPKPSAGNKIRSGHLTFAFSRAQKRGEMLRHPCILGDPQQRGTKSEVAASPLPSWRP